MSRSVLCVSRNPSLNLFFDHPVAISSLHDHILPAAAQPATTAARKEEYLRSIGIKAYTGKRQDTWRTGEPFVVSRPTAVPEYGIKLS